MKKLNKIIKYIYIYLKITIIWLDGSPVDTAAILFDWHDSQQSNERSCRLAYKKK